MNNYSEQSLINDLLANEYLTVDWESIFPQSKTEQWRISQEVSQKIFEDFFRYPASNIQKIISFFALDAQQQIKILPSLDKQTLFNFSDGDLLTDKALLVLVNQYMDTINSFSNRLLVLDLAKELIIVESAMWDIFAWIDRQDWDSKDLWQKESLLQNEWQFMRTLSGFIEQYLDIEIIVTKPCLEKIITNCLHP